jgi:hypothetical protein
MPLPEPPNPPLNSDPACIAFRSLSTSRFLGSAHRLGAGGAGQLHCMFLLTWAELGSGFGMATCTQRGGAVMLASVAQALVAVNDVTPALLFASRQYRRTSLRDMPVFAIVAWVSTPRG